MSCSPLTVAARTDRVAHLCCRAKHFSIVYVMASRLGPLGLWGIAGNEIPLRSVPCVRSRSLASGEWLKLMTYEIADVAGIAREGALVQLAAVPRMDEELDGTAQGVDGSREAARA